MNFLKHSLIFACVALITFSSCKNDVNLNAPYKEIPSIYAVLNPYESRQMIRINKVFLGEGDAYQMAKVSDSVNYQPGELTVTLKHSSNPKIITFQEKDTTTKDGSFTNKQRVYYTDSLLERSGFYTLTVKNNRTGNVFTSKAQVIDQVSPDKNAQPFSPPFRPYAPGTTVGFINYSAKTPTITVGSILFRPVDRGVVYQLIIRSHFYNDLGTRTYDNIDYVFNELKSGYMLGGVNYVRVTFKSIDYFSSAGYELSKKNLPPGPRKMFMMEYFVYASTQEYVDYNEFIKPSLSLNQNKPLYSNFENRAALGLFTFRSTCQVQKELDVSFMSALSTHPSTCKYNFENADNVVLGCN